MVHMVLYNLTPATDRKRIHKANYCEAGEQSSLERIPGCWEMSSTQAQV